MMQFLRKAADGDSSTKNGDRNPLVPAGMKPWQAAIIVVALFLLALTFPYTGDDWAWGCEISLQRLSSWFADYNGRYVGNLLVIVLTRNVVLRSVVVAAVMYAIALCVDRIAGAKGPAVFWTSLVLLPLYARLCSRPSRGVDFGVHKLCRTCAFCSCVPRGV